MDWRTLARARVNMFRIDIQMLLQIAIIQMCWNDVRSNMNWTVSTLERFPAVLHDDFHERSYKLQAFGLGYAAARYSTLEVDYGMMPELLGFSFFCKWPGFKRVFLGLCTYLLALQETDFMWDKHIWKWVCCAMGSEASSYRVCPWTSIQAENVWHSLWGTYIYLWW